MSAMETRSAAAAASVTLESLSQLILGFMKDTLEQLKKINEVIEDVPSMKKHLEELLKSHAETQEALSQMGIRIKQTEDSIGKIQDENERLSQKCVDLEWKIALLEGQSRRNNVRLLGVPQNAGAGNLINFVTKLLTDVFGDKIPKELDIQRAHRIFLRSQDKPPPVLVYFQSFQVKDAIFRVVGRKTFSYEGNEMRLTEDYPPRVMAERIKYRSSMSYFYQQGLRPSLKYPARLSITSKDNKTIRFRDASEALSYMQDFQNKMKK